MIQTPSGSPIDVGMGGALLANMLERWLDGAPSMARVEHAHDREDLRRPPSPAGLHLPAPVDARPSAPPSGKHGASIYLAREGDRLGLERGHHSHPRPGSGEDGH